VLSPRAAGSWQELHGAHRLAGTTGPEAVQRVAELVLALQHKGVPHSAGPNEQLAYLYQNQLTEEEFRQWSAAANAHSEVSDAGCVPRATFSGLAGMFFLKRKRPSQLKSYNQGVLDAANHRDFVTGSDGRGHQDIEF
jgi:hypothetical protein